jgi:hypothetical protein
MLIIVSLVSLSDYYVMPIETCHKGSDITTTILLSTHIVMSFSLIELTTLHLALQGIRYIRINVLHENYLRDLRIYC